MPSDLTTEPDQPAPGAGNMGFRIAPIWIMVSAALLTLGADQLTKYLVRANLHIGESWPREGFIRLTHGTNSGTAFGLFPQQTLLLTIASAFAIGFIIYFYRTHGGQTWISHLNVGLLLGGAVGNLIDRLAAGKVTDFIDVGPWPIFNIADSAIVVGITLLIATLVLVGDTQPEEAASDQQPREQVDAEVAEGEQR